MINKKIARPQDPYSPLWGAYWAENPMLKRGVGADGVDDVPPPDSDEPISIDPAAFKKLQDHVLALTTENETYKNKHAEAEKHRKEADRVAKENALKAAKADGNLETYEKSWTEKYSTREVEFNSLLSERDAEIDRLTVGTTATAIAAEIAMEGCAEGLMPHIQSRLKTEWKDGKARTVILDKAGNLSAMTKDELIKELKTVPYIAPLIVGSKAGGADRPGGNNGGNGKLRTRAQVDAMEPFTQAAYFKENGGKYAD